VSTLPARADAAVVGGGLFGTWIALLLARDHGLSVVLFESAEGLLRRASYNNQARVHNGYHYPRSILTGLRSRVNSGRFLAEYAECVDTRFDKYYAVGRVRSNVTAAQFRVFCQRIGAALRTAPDRVRRWFAPDLIEDVWGADEWAFDAGKLAERMERDVRAARVDVRLRHEALRVEPRPGAADRLRVTCLDDGRRERALECAWVFNCTYANLNGLLARSGLPRIPLKAELAEMALVEVPADLARAGVTVMCGPFFSVMPFPPRGLHTFSHVRYTPHQAWYERDVDVDNLAYFDVVPKRSRFLEMQLDTARFMPLAQQFVRVDSLWEVKAVLPASESDDSRPILFRPDARLAGLVSVLGGKIDNVYDIERELSATLAGGAAGRVRA
jgi:glycine/D-amino acid oxidase-like deaminating enzyme